MDVNKALLQKYYHGHCNAMEKEMVEEWLMDPGVCTNTAITDNNEAKHRMWKIIRYHTIGHRNRRYTFYIATAASLLLLFTTGIISWNRFNNLPPESAYIVIDNTNSNLLSQQRVGNILLSESAKSAPKYVSGTANNDCLLFTNSLIINNQQGEDIWVYLKTSSGNGNRMVKFLCRKKRTYVAGFVTEHRTTGSHKYLYSRQLSPAGSLPEEAATSINNQLNAAKINARYNGATTIII
jgi:hypothetical protein